MAKRKPIKRDNLSKRQRAEKTFLDEEINLEEQYSKAESFLNDNKTPIIGAIAVVALLIFIVFGFRNIYLPGQEKQAQEDMVMPVYYFEQDSFQLALNGNESFAGFEDVIADNNGMTKAVNMAHYYAGICYLNLGNFEDAIDHLKSFKSSDAIVSAMAYGALGDAYSELGNMSDAITQYKKAAKHSENGFSTPLFLLKAGMAMEAEGDYKGAKAAYEQIKTGFPKSSQAGTIDKYIARAEANI